MKSIAFFVDLLVDGFHALAGQRPGVLDPPVREAVNHAAWAERLGEGPAICQLQITRVVGMLRLFLGVEVIQIAEKFIEPVIGRQHIVAVAKVVLAELAVHVPLGLENGGDGGILHTHAFRGTRQPDLGQAGAHGRLPGNEGRTTGSTGLLSIPVGEQGTLFCDAIDVGGLIPHHAQVIGADVELANIVAPDHQDVRLGILSQSGCRHAEQQKPRTPAQKRASRKYHLFVHLGVGAHDQREG